MHRTKFQYFISDADQDMYNNYQNGLFQALERFSVGGVILTTVEKNAKEETFVICAHANKQAIAGVRLEIKSVQNVLPIEKCDVVQKNIISTKINQYTQNKKTIAELSGLWVSPDNKGGGLGRRLILEATQLALGLGICTLIAMPPAHTINYFTSLGFVPDQDIPPLAYPDDRYISRVVIYMNPTQDQRISSQLTLEDSPLLV